MRGEVRTKGVMHGMPSLNWHLRWVRTRVQGTVVVVTHKGMDEVGGDEIRQEVPCAVTITCGHVWRARQGQGTIVVCG